MVRYPQEGGCVCADLRYRLLADPVTLYACHCTDCQTQSGTSFALSMIVQVEDFEFLGAAPAEAAIELPDGRVRRFFHCARCHGVVGGPQTRFPNLALVDPGTLDDTSWLRPVGHIWTRSAQPWLTFPEGSLQARKGPSEAQMLAFVRAWKAQAR